MAGAATTRGQGGKRCRLQVLGLLAQPGLGGPEAVEEREKVASWLLLAALDTKRVGPF